MVEIWHNPRCSKSRATLALLQERDIAFTEVRYLETPPSRQRIAAVHALLGRPLIEMVRTGEAAFKEAGLTKDTADDALLDAMATHPKLIQRPIVVTDTAARIGRPPEDVLALF